MALIISRESHSARLSSSGGIPQVHLPYIRDQLLNILHRLDANSNQPGPTPVPSICNPSPSLLTGPQLLHELVDSSRGTSLAIDYLSASRERYQLSYDELHHRSDGLAKVLRPSFGQERNNGRVVPVLVPQSPDLYITLLAILKAGGAFCPLNLDAPQERIKFIVGDVSAKVLITTSGYRSKIPSIDGLHLLLVDELAEEAAPTQPCSTLSADAEDVAYVMYTSGSTGQPKGVELSHLAATQSLLAHHPQIPKFSRFLQFAAPTFDVSVFEIFFTLARGATIICCDRGTLLNDLPAVMNEMNVDAAELTPTVAASLLRERKRVSGLQLLLTIGEMLTERVVSEFGGSAGSPALLWGMYGPTEAAIHCTLETNFQSNLRPGIIGQPLSTTSALIVKPVSEDNERGSEVEVLPLGFIGELAVGGHQLAKGYLNRPEQTSKAFLSTSTYGRLYRTGDKARMLPNGTLECLGRIAMGQVKLRGQRIELGEIEQVVLKVPDCRMTVASVIDGSLVVFCIPMQDSLARDAVLEMCRNWLPAFMVPSDVIVLEEFPYLASGKIDKRRLEEDYRANLETIATSTDPTGIDSNNRVQDLLNQILPRPVKRFSELSSAGLDSLIAIKAASAFRNEGWDVGVADFLRVRNVAELEACVQVRASPIPTNHEAKDSFVELRAQVLDLESLQGLTDQIEDVYQCTPLQLSMLVETERNPKAYFNWFDMDFSPRTSAGDLKTAINALIERTEILRSGFCATADAVPYALVVWKTVLEGQIRIVEALDKDADTAELDLLRPFSVEICLERGHPKALFRLHHALYDGWSVDLMRKDLSDILCGRSSQKRPQFRVVAQYLAMEGRSSSSQIQGVKDYWEAKMTDYQPVRLTNFNGKRVGNQFLQTTTVSLSTKLELLRHGAQNLNISVQALCQAGLAYLLSSYFATSDITYGVVTSGRTLPITDIEDIVGPCIATLPLRVDVSGCQTTGDLMQTIHSLNREMLQNDSLPLRDIKRLCKVDARAPLFDVLFIWQETFQTSDDDQTAVKLGGSSDELEFPLTMELEPKGNDVFLRIRYQAALIPEAQCRIIFEQMDSMIASFCSTPKLELASLSQHLSSNVLSIENPEPAHNEFRHGLAYAVETMATTDSSRTAIEFYSKLVPGNKEVQSLSYGALNAQANQIGYHIRSLGAQPGDLICICMEKSLLFYTTVLAVIKAGAGYLPINPETPPERIRTILRDSNSELLLGQSTTLRLLPADHRLKIVAIDSLRVSSMKHANLNAPYQGGHVAYSVFTSGSTGTPKGLVVSQDNLQSNLKELAEIYPTSPNSRLLQSCSQAFDVSVFEIFFAWKEGMCLCSATNDVLFRDIEHSIREMSITHLSLTPTVAALIDPSAVPNVQFLVTAGEAVTEQVFRRWTGHGLYQGYGPAETVNICTVNPKVDEAHSINNIGPPFSNTSALVMDPTSTDLVLRGGVGELCFGGDQVCLGYLNREQLTAEKFITHQRFGRIYRSGDLGRLLPNGSILFEGRADDQVKIRGQRVELGEISRCVLDQIFIRDCVSMLIRTERAASPRIVLFWVPASHVQAEVELVSIDDKIRQQVQLIFDELISRLTSYMIPSNIVPVTAIPQTQQGKVDKRLLTTLFTNMSREVLEMTSQQSTTGEQTTEWLPIEREIAVVLCEITGAQLSDIGRSSSFFSLGIDSISAIRLCRAIEKDLKISFQVSDILRNASIAQLARISKGRTNGTRIVDDCPVPLLPSEVTAAVKQGIEQMDIEVDDILPCTPLQLSMLSASSLKRSTSYCNRITFRVRTNPLQLRHNFLRILERHVIFRTAFFGTSSPQHPFVQLVLTNHNSNISELQLDGSSTLTSIHDELEKTVIQKLKDVQPPFVVASVTRGNSHWLAFACHHALYDGIAFSQIIKEVECLCHGKLLIDPPSPRPFLQALIKSQKNETYDFWREALEDFDPAPFPTLTTDSVERQAASTHETFSTVIELSLQEIELRCRELSCTLLSLVQASWVKILALYQGQQDICFGNVLSGRHVEVEHIDELIAPCFNTIPMRVDLAGCKTNLDLVKYLQRLNAMVLPFSFASLRTIQSSLDLDGRSLFQSLVLLQQSPYILDGDIWFLEEDTGDMDVSGLIDLHI